MIRRSALRDDRGVTAVEFGLLATPLCVLLCGTLDLGYTSYMKAMVQGALQTAARDAAIGNKSAAQLDADVRARLAPLVRSPVYANCASAPANVVPLVCTTVRSYTSFSSIGKDEKLTTDYNANGRYDAGDCFEDDNDNGVYDYAATSGRGNGGNADEVVAYTVTATFRRIVPMARLLGWSANTTVTSTTMLRNQPFAKDVSPPTICV